MKRWIALSSSAWVSCVVCLTACGQAYETTDYVTQSAARPSPTQVPLDPLTIPKFAHELPIPREFAPKIRHHPMRYEYTVSVKESTVQMLPPGFPTTTVLAYGGEVKVPGSFRTE